MQSDNENPEPWVTVAVPTYNRAAGLRAAVESVKAQVFRSWELIICDNASTDETRQVAEELCRSDPRIRYYRHSENLGPTANFVHGLRLAEGRFFMWLADDDWIDANYISSCVSFLEEHPDHSLAAGRIRYYRQGKSSFDGLKIELDQDIAASRVTGYCRAVTDNGIFYGVMRTDHAKRLDLLNVMGGDWIFLAELAFLGKVKSLDATTIHRDYSWGAGSLTQFARNAGLSAFVEKHPYLSIALEASATLMRSSVFSELSPWRRRRLAWRVFFILVRGKKLRLRRLVPGLVTAAWRWRPALPTNPT
jgi:glycosyltransferase involved in cell wall biosynthesis